jgi:hypothetical protein
LNGVQQRSHGYCTAGQVQNSVLMWSGRTSTSHGNFRSATNQAFGCIFPCQNYVLAHSTAHIGTHSRSWCVGFPWRRPAGIQGPVRLKPPVAHATCLVLCTQFGLCRQARQPLQPWMSFWNHAVLCATLHIPRVPSFVFVRGNTSGIAVDESLKHGQKQVFICIFFNDLYQSLTTSPRQKMSQTP